MRWAKLFGLPDPRYIGSGNIGATNMLRTGNKTVALLTLLLDGSKGAAAVIISYGLFETSEAMLALAVLTAAVGHMYSPWLKFKGGKGMATILGGLLAFSWPVGMATILIWIIICYTTRFVSLASISALALTPLITWLRVDTDSAFIMLAACAIAIWKHRDNIKRLRDGFEPRIKFGKGQ
jgi:glycerol-3-phosphate acyltransferase PlsY